MAEENSRRRISQNIYVPVSIDGVQIVMWRNASPEKRKREEKEGNDPRLMKALGVILQNQHHKADFPAAASKGNEAAGFLKSDSDEWNCRRTEKGKPYFVHHPEIHFSLSDSDNLTAVAFAPEAAGLDIQLHRRRGIRRTEAEENDRMRKMARRFYHPDEKDFVLLRAFEDESGSIRGRQSAEHRSSIDGICRRFYRIWTAKEAFVKYTGQGIDGHFTKLSVMPETTEGMPLQMEDGLQLKRPVVWQAQGCHFWYSEPEEGLSVCLCTASALPVSVMREKGSG